MTSAALYRLALAFVQARDGYRATCAEPEGPCPHAHAAFCAARTALDAALLDTTLPNAPIGVIVGEMSDDPLVVVLMEGLRGPHVHAVLPLLPYVQRRPCPVP